MEILFLVPTPTDACSFYRSVGPFSMLRRYGIRLNTPSEINWSTVIGNDVCFMQRPYSEKHIQAAEIVKRQLPLWLDYDDNLFVVPPSNPAYDTFAQTRDSVKRLLGMANVVTVSTNELALQYSEYSDNVVVIPNAFNDSLFSFGEVESTKRVFWRGSNTHVTDLLGVKKALMQIGAEHPDWEFVFMGSAPWMLQGMQLTYRSAEDIMKYHYTIRNDLRPAIQIVPLADTVFNRAKSNIAWIEGTYAGAVTVAPKWQEWDREGVFTYTDENDFYTQLSKLMASDARPSYNALSVAEVNTHYLLSDANAHRMEILCSLAGRK